MGKKSKKEGGVKKNLDVDAFAKDVEKATEPIMDRARQIKEEVSQATSDLKQNIDKNNQVLRDKSEKLVEAGGKFTKEAVEILRPEPEVSQGRRYALRGKRLFLVLGTIVLLAILAVVGKS